MGIRGRWLPIVGAVIAVGSGAVVAYADSINADGDVLKPNNNISYTDSANFTQHCSDRGTPLAGAVIVKFNGTKHYDPGATVTLTTTLDAAGTAAGITTTGGTATVPSPWDTAGQTFSGAISTTVPVTAANGTYVVNVTASGAAHDGHGDPLTLEATDSYTISVACSQAAPTISWIASPSSANEGDLETYKFSIADPDSTSWSFASGSPSCGSGGSLAGAPSIDSSAMTGTFTCSFPNGPATSTVSVAVSDGATSNVLTQSVTVANVAPTVAFTAAPPTAFEGETKTFAFSVSDPGVTDTYSAAAGNPSCGTGGTLVAGSLALTGNHGSQTGSFACKFPSPATTTVSIAFTDSNGATGNTATTLVTVQDAPLTAGALTITDGVEGLTASQLTFSFFDTNPAGAAGDYAASIDWGDSTTSAGTVTAKTGGGFDAKANHTYAHAGTFTVVVTVNDVGGATTSATGHAVVADAPLTAGTLTIGPGVAGVTPAPLTFGFTDANPLASAADFTATIDWGDSTTSAGTIAASGTGFSVQASHTYTHAGTFAVVVTVNDAGGSTTSATGRATISSPPLTAGTLTVTNGVEGVTPAQLSFGFTDGNPGATAADYTTTIDWGDSTTSAGTVTAAGSGFTVDGSHTYADEGTFTVVVTVTNTGGSTTSATGHATVTDAPLTAGTLTIADGVASTTPSQLTFGFTDANPGAPASDFTASIAWGDSTTSTGTVTSGGRGFTVQASHTYAHSGTFTVTVTVNDVGGSSSSETAHATVTSAPLVAGTLTVTNSVEGVTPAQLSFGFTDGNPGATAADYTTTVDWGDSTTSAGTVTAGGGGFTAHGSHTYADEGTYTVVVTVTNTGGSTTSATGHATVTDAPLTAGTLTVTNGVAGVTPANLTFGFADANPGATVADFTATIDWGDSTTSAGTVAVSGTGFSVQGGHTYTHAGTFTVVVTVNDVGGSTTSATGHATVASAPLTAGTLTVTNGVEGVTPALLSFGFTDANPAATAADYTTTIAWGDATSSAGTVTAASGGGFTVQGSHTYAHAGTFTVTVTVTSAGGSTTSATGHTTIADAPLTAGTLTIGNGVAGSTPAVLTFGFTDANPAGSAADFTASIDWGDSTTSAGTVTAGGGGFTVQASHTYAHSGIFTVTVTVTDTGGSTATATGQTTIAGSTLTAGTLTIGNGVEGVTPANLTFGFTSANPLATPANFTATIKWGDTKTSAGVVTSAVGGGFTVNGSHLYADEDSYTVTVTVTDSGGGSVSATGHTTIADATLTATAPSLSPSTPAFVGTTATFTDANPNAPLGDFDAKIDWGDGDHSFGLVVRTSGGGFAVKGAHVYWHTGYYTIKTKIFDDGGSTASAQTQVLIFSFLHRGAFVIGDRSATGSVTFFSNQWWKKNSLSGGPAPSSFTGYASDPRDPSCHARWTAGSGDDAPDELPDYMAVIVSSSITKSGSKITGDTARMVIVRTVNGHGGSDHWHTGTGTVVASVPAC